jgi:hypothetical protein
MGAVMEEDIKRGRRDARPRSCWKSSRARRRWRRRLGPSEADVEQIEELLHGEEAVGRVTVEIARG